MKFTILSDSINLQDWQYNSIKELLKINGLKCETIYINDNLKLTNKSFKNIFFRIFFKLFFKSKENKKSIKDLIPNVVIKNVKTKKVGIYKEEFMDSEINEIKDSSLSFIVRFGFGILSGDILKVSKYGVWSFHHGDNNKYKGRPACFWEMYNSEKNINGMLQVLSEKLDDGQILSTWNIKCNNSNYFKNLSEIKKSGIYELRKTILKIKNNIPIKDDKKNIMSYRPNKIPTNIEFLNFLKIIFKSYLISFFEKLFIQNWIIIIENLNKEKYKLVKTNDKGSFMADPFLMKIGKNIIIFYEFYCKKLKKGQINHVVLDHDFKNLSSGISLKENFHLSYPCFFKYRNNNYIIPEMSKSNRQDIYKVNKDLRLSFHKNILKNINISDPTIFFFNNMWWIFGNCNFNELHIWYAKTPFSKWVPHELNPVKVDVKSNRPAGNLFVLNNTIFRPTQDLSNYYGEKIIINKIINLSEHDFFEEEFERIDYNTFSKKYNAIGVHTMNSLDDFKVYDLMNSKLRFF